jgi:hypothetical protein
MTTDTAIRVTYAKATPPTEHGDYVDARFDVFLDGELIAQVTRDRSTQRTTYSGQRYGYDRTATVWEVDADNYRDFGRYYTRMDAVMQYLRDKRGMSYDEARAAVGKRGRW